MFVTGVAAALAPWIDDASIAKPASTATTTRRRRAVHRKSAAELLQTLLETSVISVSPSSRGSHWPPRPVVKVNLGAGCFWVTSPRGWGSNSCFSCAAERDLTKGRGLNVTKLLSPRSRAAGTDSVRRPVPLARSRLAIKARSLRKGSSRSRADTLTESLY